MTDTERQRLEDLIDGLISAASTMGYWEHEAGMVADCDKARADLLAFVAEIAE